MADLDETVRVALASFQRLNEGKSAPSVAVRVDGQHASASWVGESAPTPAAPSAPSPIPSAPPPAPTNAVMLVATPAPTVEAAPVAHVDSRKDG